MWIRTQEGDYLKHERLILKQPGNIFVVGIGPVIGVRVFSERSYVCSSLVPGPAEKVCEFGLHVGTLGFKQRPCENRKQSL